MTAFGVTPIGFTKPSIEDLISQMQADQLAQVSRTLDVSPSSLIGQLNAIYAFYLAEAWEAARGAYDSFDPDKADGAALTVLSKLTGVMRRAAAPSQAALTCTLTAGTKLITDTHFASVLGRPDVKWTPIADFTAPSDGNFAVPFVSEAKGEVLAAIDTITVISTPVVGWSAIVGSSAVTLGRDVDTGATLRARRLVETGLPGSGTVAAIASRVLQIADTVTVLSNTSDAIDVNGLPPHSFEAIVSSSATDDAIAQVIWDHGAAGIPSCGTSSGNAVDRMGTTQIVRFTRPVLVPIWISYAITPRVGYDHAAFLAGVFEALSEGVIARDSSGALTTIVEPYATGVNVVRYDLMIATQGLRATVNAVTFGLSASPVTSTDIAIGVRQIAAFDLSRITVTP